MNEPTDTHPPLLLRVPDAARMLGIGRSLTYELIDAGHLEVVHINSVMRVPLDAIHAYVEERRTQETGRSDRS